MKISVCIPTYNSADVIGETIDSLVKQSMDDFEIIVTDNSKGNGIERILDRYDFSHLRYDRNIENIGYVNNANKSVELANSDIVAVYHSDDIYEQDILKKQYEILKKYNDVAAVFTRKYDFNGNQINNRKNSENNFKLLETLNCYDKENNIFLFDKSKFYETVCKIGNIFTCPTLMIRKDIYVKLHGYKDTFKYSEDLDFWFRIIMSGYKIAIYNEPLINYRHSEKQGSEEARRSTELATFFNVVDYYRAEFKKYENPDIVTHYNKQKATGYIRAAKQCLISDNDKLKENLRLSMENYKYDFFTKRGLFQRFGIFMANPLGKMILKIGKRQN